MNETSSFQIFGPYHLASLALLVVIGFGLPLAVRRLGSEVLARRVAVGSSEEGVVPARSLAEVKIADVIAAFIPMGDEQMRQRPIELAIEEIVSSFRDAGFDAVGETTFLELVERLK